MIINYTGKNLQVTDEMRDEVESQLSKLDKYFDKEVRCDVTLSTFKHNTEVEITIDLPGAFIRSEVSDTDLRTALDRATDVLSRQIRKHKTKLQKKYRGKETIRLENIPDWPKEEAEDEEDKIVKVKTFSMMPMSEEEAILQMELVGHNFYVFINSANDEVNVLYKRRAGGYGLIVPEF